MASKRQVAAAVIILDECEVIKKPRKNRKKWVKSWLLKRQSYSHMTLLNHLKENDPDDFKNYLRMSETKFLLLLEKVSPMISKQDTNMRPAISAEERLAATLRFLATGRSFEDLKFSTVISPQLLGKIIPETCRAIYSALRAEYMKLPTTPEEWIMKAADFNHWDFPNCGGAIDGKHIAITCPPNSGSYFYNYKGFFSVVLLAIVDANYQFVMVDVGCNGRISDGGVLELTEFYSRLKTKQLNLPGRDETVEGLNYVFIGDSAFALRPDVLKPFPQKGITHDMKIYNYRLSRARRVVENAFGILASRFRIFHTTINLSPDKVEDIVQACTVLHNFLRRNSKTSYLPHSALDREDIENGTVIEGDWRKDLPPSSAYAGLQVSARNVTEEGRKGREEYLKYFNGVGQVEWQEKMIR